VRTQSERVAKLSAQVASLRQQEIDPSASDPQIQPAQQEVEQLLAQKAKADEDIRNAEIFASNELGGIKGAEIDERLMSRFLAKVAIEILAERLMQFEGWEEALIDDPQLDPLRRFARLGDKPGSWPFSRRRIYGEDDMQMGADGPHQVLHEYTLLYTDARELYAVVCVFGEEFTINYGGPEIEGYMNWLKVHGERSPLYLTDKLPFPVFTA
jgi:hypothetical protein